METSEREIQPEGATEQKSIGLRPELELSAFRFDVLQGSDAGNSLVLEGVDKLCAYVGSSEACDLVLRDRMVSRRHVSLSLEPGQVRLVDMNSTNGTRVQDVEVKEAMLRGGERLVVGDTVIQVSALSATQRLSLSPSNQFGPMIGVSALLRRLWNLAERVARTNVPVIIEGETGTGKELLAEAIHEHSQRASKDFVVFDCTTGSPTLIESMLFGHEKGAFTSADRARPGVFEEADGGTLLIDEIGDLDLSLQSKLLRAIQKGEIQRLGSSKWKTVDVRVIAATRRDLEKEVQAGRFRDDLYYRLAVARLTIPPLRQRKEDIRCLAEAFWQRNTNEAIDHAFIERLASYNWPGNARELQNTILHRVALGDLAGLETIRIDPSSKPPPRLAQGLEDLDRILNEDLPFLQARQQAVAVFEKAYTQRLLEKHGGNVSQAARAAGIARRYFYTVRARSESP